MEAVLTFTRLLAQVSSEERPWRGPCVPRRHHGGGGPRAAAKRPRGQAATGWRRGAMQRRSGFLHAAWAGSRRPSAARSDARAARSIHGGREAPREAVGRWPPRAWRPPPRNLAAGSAISGAGTNHMAAGAACGGHARPPTGFLSGFCASGCFLSRRRCGSVTCLALGHPKNGCSPQGGHFCQLP